MAYLVLVVMGFMLIISGTVGYYLSTMVEVTKVNKIFTVRDGNTGQILQENFEYDVAKYWKIIPRQKGD